MCVQTEAALLQAHVSLFLVYARAGLVPLDEEIARWLRGSTTPIVLVANKAEGRAGEAGVYEAMALGLGDPVRLSAEHGEGMGDQAFTVRVTDPGDRKSTRLNSSH